MSEILSGRAKPLPECRSAGGDFRQPAPPAHHTKTKRVPLMEAPRTSFYPVKHTVRRSIYATPTSSSRSAGRLNDDREVFTRRRHGPLRSHRGHVRATRRPPYRSSRRLSRQTRKGSAIGAGNTVKRTVP